MGVKDVWNKLKKGVRAGMAAVQVKNIIDDDQILGMIQEFNSSEKRKLMLTGRDYYQVDNDIYKRKMQREIDGKIVDESYKANNKLAHSKYKVMVDEKVNYLLAKPYTLKCDDEEYTKKVTDTLGKHFGYKLTRLGYDASNKGIAWLQPYIDEKGNFNTMIIPSEQCIPIWKDNSHMELDGMIRMYESTYWLNGKKQTETNVEVWSSEGVVYYKIENNSTLVFDYDRNNNDVDNGVPIAHYQRDGEWVSWGKVPFIPFKNNAIELADIKFVKSLLDQYDKSRSEAANYVEDTKNIIYILKGYGGEDIGEFMQRLNYYRAIPIDDVQDGGVDTITPTMDITALREHYEQLKRDLIEDGQSINKDLDKFGSTPSGVALKFMYAGLDLKCNALETEFKMGFENLVYFVNIYLGETNQGNYSNVDLDIIFNRNMEINQTEVITNCVNSKGTISDKTIIANHPWVSDVEEEEKALEEQNKASLPFQDKIPLNGGGANEQ